MIDLLLDMETALERFSPAAFLNACAVSKSKDKNVLEAFRHFYHELECRTDEEIIAIQNAVIGITHVNIMLQDVVY